MCIICSGRHPDGVGRKALTLPANQPVNAQRSHLSTSGWVCQTDPAPLQGLQQIQHAPPSCPIVQVQDAARSSREDDLDKDSGSKVMAFTPFHQLVSNTFPSHDLTGKGRYNSISVSQLNSRNEIKLPNNSQFVPVNLEKSRRELV